MKKTYEAPEARLIILRAADALADETPTGGAVTSQSISPEKPW